MKTSIFVMTLIAALGWHVGTAAIASADMSQLISTLMNNLDVSKEQGTGGAGAVFASAKDKMNPADFLKVSDALPGIDDLIAAAPKISGSSGSATTGVSSMVGGLSGSKGAAAQSLGGLSNLADAFSQLGLDSDMVGKYVDTILQFANSEGGKGVMNLLKNALL